VDWKGCDRMISRQIWNTMWNKADDLIWGEMWIGRDYIVCCHDQFNVLCGLEKCDRKLSRTTWSTMWIKTDDRGWCHDLIWHDIWIGTDIKECCLDQMTVLCGLECMWQETFTTNMKYNVDYKRC
jgi:hypothetical protein